MFVRLKGKTQHGKNRIHQHGDVWEVTSISIKRQLMWLDSQGETFRLKDLKMKDSRNIRIWNDEHFEIVEFVK